MLLAALLGAAALVLTAGMDLLGIGIAVTLVSVLVGAIGEDRVRRIIDHALPTVTPAVFTVVGVSGYLLNVGPGQVGFYAACAQILPVLIIGLTIEAGLFGAHPSRLSDARVSLLSLFLLGLGEVAALRALARGHGGREEFVIVVASIAAAFAGLAATAVVDHRKRHVDA